jgi:Ran GTPase-activating protein (RanGAP) involved in mRNA processing and transport
MAFDGDGEDYEHEEEDEEVDNEDNEDDEHGIIRYSDNNHHRYLDLEMRMIERNDPKLTRLDVGYLHRGAFSVPPGDDWAGLGNAIGRSKHLNELFLYDYDHDKSVEYLLNFLPGLALNCSIKKLRIGGWNLSDGEVWNYLTQFFKYNRNFECLIITNQQSLSRLSYPELISALRRFDSLNEFTLSDYGDKFCGKACVKETISALTNDTELRRLSLSGVYVGLRDIHTGVSRPGCVALATLLKNPRSNLSALHLSNTNIDDLGATIIATGLRSSTTLSEIVFSYENNITGTGWEAIFAAFRSSRCMLTELDLSLNSFNDAATLGLFCALLRHNTTIKTLNLGNAEGITDAGWITLFQLLRYPTVILDELHLNNNLFTNEVLAALTDALANNSLLRELSLNSVCVDDSGQGLVDISNVFQNPNSALEILYLGNNPINDQTIISFAEALAGNCRLKYLLLNVRPSNTSVTSIGYDALIKLLCNKSSIMDTYLSNHTLETIDDDYYGFGHDDNDDNDEVILPEDLVSLLEINRENNASQASRLKIIQTHFSGSEINMQPFMDLDLSVKPFVIAWMVKDNNGYPLLRALPSLLELSSSVGKARSKKRPYE